LRTAVHRGIELRIEVAHHSAERNAGVSGPVTNRGSVGRLKIPHITGAHRVAVPVVSINEEIAIEEWAHRSAVEDRQSPPHPHLARRGNNPVHGVAHLPVTRECAKKAEGAATWPHQLGVANAIESAISQEHSVVTVLSAAFGIQRNLVKKG